jgi:hypothetical protein
MIEIPIIIGIPLFMGKLTAAIRVADEVWIATALLHREHPEAPDFSSREIEARVIKEGLTDAKRPGVAVHISSHCVANRKPDTGRYRMLFETAKSRRRLFRSGDYYDPGREGGRLTPDRSEIPAKYHSLLDWYEGVWNRNSGEDPLMALAGRHRDLWGSIEADDYVRGLREGFE